MRKCPFCTNGKEMPDSLFACAPHWKRLTTAERREIWRAYSEYLAGGLSLAQLRETQQPIIDAAKARM